MAVYAAGFAKLYDLFHSEKPYEAESTFVDRVLRAQAHGPSERLLDVACGTGQHAARLAGRGWAVVAVDQSADMLRIARDRPAAEAVRFVQADMRNLNLPDSELDAAICLFDSIGYALTNEAISQTLSGIRRHLRPNGLFMVEFWHAAAMIRAYEPLRVRKWDTQDGSIVRVSRTSLDTERQVARVRYDVDVHKPGGHYEVWTEEHENRYFLVQEMDLLLRGASFEPVQFFAGFDDAAPIEADTWHVIGLARATEASP